MIAAVLLPGLGPGTALAAPPPHDAYGGARFLPAPGYEGKVVRYKMRKNKRPSARVLCLPPGAARRAPGPASEA